MATTDLERLIVSLEASTTKYERALTKAMGQTNKTARQIEGRFARMNRNLDATFSGAASGFLRAFIGVEAVRGATRLVDASTRISNSLKVAGLEGKDLQAVYASLFASAQKNAAPLESLAELYSRASLSAADLGASQEQLLGFIDKVSVALRVNGKSVEESSGALLQLSQLLGSGTVRAEEFNSVQEGALPILQAVANGLEEAGGSVSKLRSLVIAGKVSSQAFFDAFNAGAGILDDKVANAELTVSQAFVRLQNVLIDVAGQFNANTNASKLLAGGIEDLGTGIQDLAAFLNNITGPLLAFAQNLQAPINKVRELEAAISQITGLDRIGFGAATAINNMGLGPAFEAKSTAAGRVVDQTFKLIGETPQDEALAKILTGQQTPAPAAVPVTATEPAAPSVAPNTVSLKDYPISSTRSGGRGGSSPVERERKAVKGLIEDLQAEYDQLGMTAEQKEIANALRQAGAAATEEERNKIVSLITATNAEQEAIEATQDAMREFASISEDALSGFISDVMNGKSAAEALGNALSNIGNRLLNKGLDMLFSSIFPFADGGIAAHGKPLKTFANGGVSRTAAIFGETGRPEAAVPLPDGRRIPVELRMPSMPKAGGAAGGGEIQVSATMAVENGNLVPVITQVSGQVAGHAVKQYDNQLQNRTAEKNRRYG